MRHKFYCTASEFLNKGMVFIPGKMYPYVVQFNNESNKPINGYCNKNSYRQHNQDLIYYRLFPHLAISNRYNFCRQDNIRPDGTCNPFLLQFLRCNNFYLFTSNVRIMVL